MDVVAASPLLKSFLAGSFSGTCSTLLFQPLDLVKTRLQTPVHAGAHPGTLLTVVTGVLRTETFVGLWRGMTPSIARCVPGVGVYFCSLHFLTTKFTSGKLEPVEAIVLGATARSISGISLLPFTVIKTRFESREYNYRGVVEALRKIYATEGARGLYCGLIPTLMRDAPFSGIYLLFYTQTKGRLPQDWLEGKSAPATHFCCGVFAGILASASTQPADVVKTYAQLYPDRFHNICQAVVYVYQRFGVKGYFRGLVPRMIRRTLVTALAWTVYEQATSTVGLK